jgi:hypothetical protein
MTIRMNRLVAVLAAFAIGGMASAASIPKYNAATVDVSKVTGNYNSYRWVWPGYSAQDNHLWFNDGGTDVSLTGYSGAFKVIKKTSSGQTAYISISAASITIASNEASFSVLYTNIPPDGEYLSEFWVYETASPANARVLAQGKIVAIDSLYATDDSTYPWPTNQDTLANYVPITRTITVDGTTGTLSSNLSFTSSGTTGTTFTNYLAGDTEIIVTGDARSGSNVLSIASTITRDSEVQAATGAVYTAALAGAAAAGDIAYLPKANPSVTGTMTLTNLYGGGINGRLVFDGTSSILYPVNDGGDGQTLLYGQGISYSTNWAFRVYGYSAWVSDDLTVGGDISEGGTALSSKYTEQTLVAETTNFLTMPQWYAPSNRWAFVEYYGSTTNYIFITPAR